MPSLFSKSQAFLSALLHRSEPAQNLQLMRRVGPRTNAVGGIEGFAKRIRLPSLAVADEELTRLALWEEARKMGRQEMWDELSERLRLADTTRSATPGGMPEAALLAMGAHADVVAAAEDALADCKEPNSAGLSALEDVCREYRKDYAIALIVALAHLRIARVWQKTVPLPPGASSEIVTTHIDRATALLSGFDTTRQTAPSLAAANCLQAELRGEPASELAHTYRHLIAMEPHCPQHLRAYGSRLLEAPGGSLTRLEDEALSPPQESQAVWGHGGYTWMWLDVLEAAPERLASVNADHFIAGLRDVLSGQPDQYLVNQITAFCALSMAPDDALSARADTARAQIHGCLDWIFERHLHELHPRLWAGVGPRETEAQSQTGQRALVAQGRKRALHSIATYFADQLADGSTIAFSPAGMYRLPAI